MLPERTSPILLTYVELNHELRRISGEEIRAEHVPERHMEKLRSVAGRLLEMLGDALEDGWTNDER